MGGSADGELIDKVRGRGFGLEVRYGGNEFYRILPLSSFSASTSQIVHLTPTTAVGPVSELRDWSKGFIVIRPREQVSENVRQAPECQAMVDHYVEVRRIHFAYLRTFRVYDAHSIHQFTPISSFAKADLISATASYP